MPVPEYNAIKAPALQFFTDGQPHRITEVYTEVAKHFALTEHDLSEMLPSGTQTRWHNRANWACYDLSRAGLLDRPKRGVYVITERGRKVAEKRPDRIDRDFLMQFEEFANWIAATESKDTSGGQVEASDTRSGATPNEIIDAAFRSLQVTLRSELLDLVMKMDPRRFERLVLDLLVAMGYGGSREEAARMTKASNDEGIDGVINEDRLGLDVIYVQAKRWQANTSVGRKEIQSFVGALAGQQAHKGIFITTSSFAGNATEYARKVSQRVILVDGNRLADLMIEHNIGVATAHAYEVKRIDSNYFEEG